jgi:signal transduction histidine kinase
VKVLIPSNDIIDKILQKSEKGEEEKEGKQKEFETRRIDLTSEIKSNRKASLVTELREDSKENFLQAIGLTSYSTSKPTVLSYTSIFENFWKQVELYEQLKIHDRMQKEFIDIAAHELRSPTQPILGLSEVLKSKEGNIKEYNELIDVINRNAKRLQHLAEDILDVARIEGKLLLLRKSHFDLKKLILNIIADYTSQIIREGMDTKRVKLAIVVVNIQDTGKGIDPTIRDKIFGKFTTTSEKGMGLGLSLSRKIIESHGGEIWAANNTSGKGATFGFSIPANSGLKNAE